MFDSSKNNFVFIIKSDSPRNIKNIFGDIVYSSYDCYDRHYAIGSCPEDCDLIHYDSIPPTLDSIHGKKFCSKFAFQQNEVSPFFTVINTWMMEDTPIQTNKDDYFHFYKL